MTAYEKIPEMVDARTPKLRKRLVQFGIVALIGLAGWGGWELVVANKGAVSAEEMSARVTVLSERLRVIDEELSLALPDEETSRRRALIEEAVAAQNELMRLQPGAGRQADTRLSEWQSRLDELDVAAWNRQSRELEARAQEEIDAGRGVEVVDLLKEALVLQQKINGSFASRTSKNYGRESRLQQEIERLVAEPLLLAVRELMDQGRIAAEGGRWQEAIARYESAREQQMALNREHPRTRFASALAVERIESELATLWATGLHEEMQAALAAAGVAGEAGQIEDAETLLTKAEEKQRAINEQYAKSRFVSTERFAQIEVTRQTMRARLLVREVEQLDERATAHLQRRELFQAQKLIKEALQKADAISTDLPKATGLNDALRQRLSYLNLRQGEIAQIQDQVYDLLAPLPGARVSLMKTEVPQSLYLRVMNSNPSRHGGKLHAVDSVTFAEAQEFCRRVSWVLGRPVRLPTLAEFTVALGQLAQNTGVWGSETSAGRSQPVGQKAANAAGFYDLLGNVAEWVSESTESEATIAGGSYADSLGETTTLPVVSVSKTARARTTGFRVVVELDPAAP